MTYDGVTIAGIAFVIGSIFGAVLIAVLNKIADLYIRYGLRERFGISDGEKPKPNSDYKENAVKPPDLSVGSTSRLEQDF
jgi:hypothetical protein